MGHAVGLREPLRVAVEHVDTVRVGDRVLEAQSVPLTVPVAQGEGEADGEPDTEVVMLKVGLAEDDMVPLTDAEWHEDTVPLGDDVEDTQWVPLTVPVAQGEGDTDKDLVREFVTLVVGQEDGVEVPLREAEEHEVVVPLGDAVVDAHSVPLTVPDTQGEEEPDRVAEAEPV